MPPVIMKPNIHARDMQSPRGTCLRPQGHTTAYHRPSRTNHGKTWQLNWAFFLSSHEKSLTWSQSYCSCFPWIYMLSKHIAQCRPLAQHNADR
jgi:hypothetical protein